MNKTMPGLNIQWPWSELLLSGRKSIETRTYPLPKKYEGVELAVIETPGPKGKKEAGINKARITGTIIFGASFQYKSENEWRKDAKRHLVNPDDIQYSWTKTDNIVWGWTVEKVTRLKSHEAAPKKRGIIFASICEIPSIKASKPSVKRKTALDLSL